MAARWDLAGPRRHSFVSTGDGVFDPAAGDYSNTFLAAAPGLTGVRDYFSPSNWSAISKQDLDLPSGGLLEFTFNGKELLAGVGKELVIYLLDAHNLSGSNHQRPLYISPVLANQGRAAGTEKCDVRAAMSAVHSLLQVALNPTTASSE